jgi:hypothetical protein
VSADPEFTPTGGVTRIGWEQCFSKIKTLAEKVSKTKDGKETINMWNQYVFANTCAPDEIEDIDEGNDEYAQLEEEVDMDLLANGEEGEFHSHKDERYLLHQNYRG